MWQIPSFPKSALASPLQVHQGDDLCKNPKPQPSWSGPWLMVLITFTVANLVCFPSWIDFFFQVKTHPDQPGRYEPGQGPKEAASSALTGLFPSTILPEDSVSAHKSGPEEPKDDGTPGYKTDSPMSDPGQFYDLVLTLLESCASPIQSEQELLSFLWECFLQGDFVDYTPDCLCLWLGCSAYSDSNT